MSILVGVSPSREVASAFVLAAIHRFLAWKHAGLFNALWLEGVSPKCHRLVAMRGLG